MRTFLYTNPHRTGQFVAEAIVAALAYAHQMHFEWTTSGERANLVIISKNEYLAGARHAAKSRPHQIVVFLAIYEDDMDHVAYGDLALKVFDDIASQREMIDKIRGRLDALPV
jgi:hypothetical protein